MNRVEWKDGDEGCKCHGPNDRSDLASVWTGMRNVMEITISSRSSICKVKRVTDMLLVGASCLHKGERAKGLHTTING